jgi:hypothetical protein
MPQNRYNSFQSSPNFGDEIMQSVIAQTPGAFDYAELDKKYPTRQVRPILPEYIQQEMEDERIARKEKLANQRIREAQASIYESKLNEDIAAAEQVPLAREYFSKLNPQSADWPEQRDAGFAEFPLIENHPFAKSRIASMDRLHDNWAKKNLSSDAARDKYQKAQKEKFNIQQLRDSGTIDKAEADEYIGMLDQSINEARGQLKMPPISSAPSAVSLQNPSMKEGKIYRQNGKNYKYTNGQFVELP